MEQRRVDGQSRHVPFGPATRLWRRARAMAVPGAATPVQDMCAGKGNAMGHTMSHGGTAIPASGYQRLKEPSTTT